MKKIFAFFAIAALMISGCGSGEESGNLPRGKTSSAWTTAIESFIRETKSIESPDVAVPYSIMVVDHGKVVFEQFYEGFTQDSTIEVYSVAKTILALAVGCAVDEGLFSVEDRVVDFFPDKLPENVSDTLSSMTVRHLLTMTCGMKESPKLLSVFSGNDDFDWINEFFYSTQANIPGTAYYYNFFAPYIVAAILEKTSGMGVVDYMEPRLLKPMHITDLSWKNSPAGTCLGGWGVQICTEDMAKIGQLLLQHGQWNGHQLVSKKWVDTMTSNLVASAPLSAFTPKMDPEMLNDPENDHSMGYGYYVWQGRYHSYRAEGLLGRHIIVVPDKELVFVITSNSNMDQRYFDLIWKHFGHLFN